MKITHYLDSKFKKNKYGFGNFFSDKYINSIKKYENKYGCRSIKIRDDYYMFIIGDVEFSIETRDGNHKITQYIGDKYKVNIVKYYNYKILYKLIKEIIYSNTFI